VSISTSRPSAPIRSWQYAVIQQVLPAAAVLCALAAVASVLTSRSLAQQITVVEWARATVFLILPVTMVVGLGVPFVMHLRRSHVDSRWLVIGTVSFVMALLAARMSNGAAGLLREQSLETISVGPHSVAIHGAIASDLVSRLQQTLDSQLSVDTVELDNNGGNPLAAIAAAQWLRERGARRAVVTGRCASACAYMALLFPERYLQAGAALGFHRVISFTGNHDEAAQAQRRLRDVFIGQGLRPDVIDGLFASDALRWPSVTELLNQGLITGCWDSQAGRPAGCARS